MDLVQMLTPCTAMAADQYHILRIKMPCRSTHPTTTRQYAHLNQEL